MKPLIHLFSITGILMTTSAPAFATEIRPFDSAAFQTAQASGKTIVLAFHKEGCPACAAQEPKLESALKPQDSSHVEAYRVEFDSSSAIAKRFHVVKQTTLVVLKGDQVQAQQVGITDEMKIKSLIEKGV